MDALQQVISHTPVYTFTEGSWWDGNGCSCCEPTKMVYYNNDEGLIPHSLHSEESCYASALSHFFKLDYPIDTLIEGCDLGDLKFAAEEAGIIVTIINEG